MLISYKLLLKRFNYRNLIRRCDAFAKPISFSRRGQDPYKTVCGGFVTLLILALTIFYLALLLMYPVSHNLEIAIDTRILILI